MTLEHLVKKSLHRLTFYCNISWFIMTVKQANNQWAALCYCGRNIFSIQFKVANTQRDLNEHWLSEQQNLLQLTPVVWLIRSRTKWSVASLFSVPFIFPFLDNFPTCSLQGDQSIPGGAVHWPRVHPGQGDPPTLRSHVQSQHRLWVKPKGRLNPNTHYSSRLID